MNKQSNGKYGLAKVLAAIGAAALLGSVAAAAAARFGGRKKPADPAPSPKKRGKKAGRGFTMVELLIVMAIVMALSAVGFLGVTRYQKDMKLLEMDAVAKQIFIAAQNHLTVAKSQGYLKKTDGKMEDENNGIYYFIVSDKDTNGSYIFTDPDAASGKILSLMLPFASVDETVRKGGSYIIRYQNKQDVALVLDVFYAARSGSYSCSFGTDDYNTLFKLNAGAVTGANDKEYRGAENKSNRRNYNGAIIGWYGSEEGDAGQVAASPEELELLKPQLIIHNEEKLWVELLDPNTGKKAANGGPLQWNLIVKGMTSNSSRKVKLTSCASSGTYNRYTFTLDDITGTLASLPETAVLGNDMSSSGHFDTLFCKIHGSDAKLLPGENIQIWAEVDVTTTVGDTGKIVDVQKSKTTAYKTNSLFYTGSFTGSENANTALIKNFRHLENLYGTISGLNVATLSSNGVSFTTAKQMNDLDWPGFVVKLKELCAGDAITTAGGGTLGQSGFYQPVSPAHNDQSEGLTYDGNGKTIKRLIVRTSGPAGVFGEYKKGVIRDLTIQDPSVKSTSDAAGALVGSVTGTKAYNVVARNENGDESYTVNLPDSVSMSAGRTAVSSTDGLPLLWVRGLSGLTQRGTAVPLAAKSIDLCVEGVGSAGGLVGSMDGGEINFCAAALFVNSTGSGGAAGGLVGTASGTGTIRGSYASGHTKDASYDTNSWNVSAAGTAGGLVGVSGGTLDVECSYSTCSVTGNTAGGFIGSVTGSTTVDTCYCTGLVQGTSSRDAFCNGSPALHGVNRYIKHEETVQTADGAASYIKSAVSGVTGIVAEEWANQADFIRSGDAAHPRGTADSYDGYLKLKYGRSYLFPTVKQLYAQANIEYTLTADATPEEKTLAEYFTGSTIEAHIGDWYVPIPVPVEYEWINGDILALKIDFTRYYGLNQDHSPATILAAVTGKTSGNTRFFMLSRKQGSNEYEFAGEMTIGRASTGSGTGIDWASSYDKNTNKWTYRFDPTAWTIKNDHVNGTTADPDKYVTLVFDDITVNGSASTFSKLMCEETDTNDNFIPGENLIVRVNTLQSWEELQSDWNTLTTPKKAKTQTNSLFADGSDPLNAATKTANIASIRHLENLDGSISGYVPGGELTATQTEDLDWTAFKSTTKTRGDVVGNTGYAYAPVNTAYNLDYQGKDSTGTLHSITGVIAEPASGNAGVFGALDEYDSVSNLKLVNITATATTGDAGALAGASDGTVTNILVCLENASGKMDAADYTDKQIQTASGSAGGLVGSMTGGKVEKCAAAVRVLAAESGGTAGGLIGSVTGGTVSASYSGGHTENGKYSDTSFNVDSAGMAGGLIGSYEPSAGSGSQVEYCYSTCSVQGYVAGGLVGKANRGTITYCYCAGKVSGTTEGAFGGMVSSQVLNCSYLSIVNERQAVKALGTENISITINAMDADAGTYNTYLGKDRNTAAPYDSTLPEKYSLLTVDQLLAKDTVSTEKPSVSSDDLVSTHYGDWPAVETLVVNESASASTP